MVTLVVIRFSFCCNINVSIVQYKSYYCNTNNTDIAIIIAVSVLLVLQNQGAFIVAILDDLLFNIKTLLLQCS